MRFAQHSIIFGPELGRLWFDSWGSTQRTVRTDRTCNSPVQRLGDFTVSMAYGWKTKALLVRSR